jgi:hypothetical protein
MKIEVNQLVANYCRVTKPVILIKGKSLKYGIKIYFFKIPTARITELPGNNRGCIRYLPYYWDSN